MNIIKLIKYIIVGMVQGFTEPLPISSSGHVYVFKELFNIEVLDINFAIVVNAGSLIAIIVIFRKRILELIIGFFKYAFKKQESYKKDFHYALMVLVGVIPAGVASYFLKSVVNEYLLSLATIGVGLLVTAIALNLFTKEAVTNTTEDITYKDALVIGFFQIFAIMPGISRSGVTLVGGLSRKIKFEEVVKFSFMLYIPISIAAMIVGLLDLSSNSPFVLGYVLAFISSGITTFFALKWFLSMVRKGNLRYFSFYCTIVGVILVIVGFYTGK